MGVDFSPSTPAARPRASAGQNLMNNTLTVNGRVVADHIVDRVRSDLAVNYWRTAGGEVDDPKVKPKVKPLEFSANNVAQWLNEACRQPGLGYHPIQDQLRRLPPWDRTPRVDRMIESCFNLDCLAPGRPTPCVPWAIGWWKPDTRSSLRQPIA